MVISSLSFTENAIKVLEKRYLQPNESPEGMLKRVSFGVDDYYDLMARLDFLPNSPTLFNAGTGHGTFSACFKFDIEDSMESIMDVARKAAMVQKWGGGVGYVLSNLRAKGTPINSTHGKACGPIEVLKMLHSVSNMITQGGKRDGAQMAILHCDHPDVREFIHCKDINPDSLSTFNISVAITHEFMNAVKNNPNSDQAKLFQEMAESAWRTGDPGCYFIDISEETNPTPWIAPLTGTNPCGEVPLINNEPCNLGSINLGHHITMNQITSKLEVNLPKLEYTTRIATRFLDDILDNNWFPDPEISKAALLTRKLGLGVMGLADMFAILNIHYDSEEAIHLSEFISENINRWAYDESVKLAQRKGVCPAYESLQTLDPEMSIWNHPMVKKLGVTVTTPNNKVQASVPLPRNSTRTCIAPTGTISILAGASSGIEPHFAIKWTRYMGDGTPLEETIPVLDRCNGFIPHTSMEIESSWHIRHQAAWQKNTDLAVSKTINLPNSASVQNIYESYMSMYDLGCKGGTIYRDGSRDTQVLNTQPRESLPLLVETSNRRKLPDEREAINHKFSVGEQEGYINVGLFEDRSPGEVFITINKEGSTTRGLLDTIGILTSLCLQYNVPLDKLTSKMQGITFEPNGFTSNRAIPQATSIIDYIFHWMRHRFIPDTVHEHSDKIAMISGILCPDCGSQTIRQDGCLTCVSLNCGWSKCG